eukprot:1035707-Pelagomonas_calceolata.AAC.1
MLGENVSPAADQPESRAVGQPLVTLVCLQRLAWIRFAGGTIDLGLYNFKFTRALRFSRRCRSPPIWSIQVQREPCQLWGRVDHKATHGQDAQGFGLALSLNFTLQELSTPGHMRLFQFDAAPRTQESLQRARPRAESADRDAKCKRPTVFKPKPAREGKGR